jgi:hypothetical protein
LPAASYVQVLANDSEIELTRLIEPEVLYLLRVVPIS